MQADAKKTKDSFHANFSTGHPTYCECEKSEKIALLNVQFGIWNLESVESGIWNLESGIWIFSHMRCDPHRTLIWNLESGIWNLDFGLSYT